MKVVGGRGKDPTLNLLERIPIGQIWDNVISKRSGYKNQFLL